MVVYLVTIPVVSVALIAMFALVGPNARTAAVATIVGIATDLIGSYLTTAFTLPNTPATEIILVIAMTVATFAMFRIQTRQDGETEPILSTPRLRSTMTNRQQMRDRALEANLYLARCDHNVNRLSRMEVDLLRETTRNQQLIGHWSTPWKYQDSELSVSELSDAGNIAIPLVPVAEMSGVDDHIIDHFDLHQYLDIPGFINLDMHLPIFTIVQAVAEKWKLAQTDRIDIARTAADIAARSGAAVAGGAIGGAVLFYFTGPHGAIFGKAGGAYLAKIGVSMIKKYQLESAKAKYEAEAENINRKMATDIADFQTFFRDRKEEFADQAIEVLGTLPQIDHLQEVRTIRALLASATEAWLANIAVVRRRIPISARNEASKPSWLRERRTELSRSLDQLNNGKIADSIKSLISINYRGSSSGWGISEPDWKEIVTLSEKAITKYNNNINEWRRFTSSEIKKIDVDVMAQIQQDLDQLGESISAKNALLESTLRRYANKVRSVQGLKPLRLDEKIE